MAALIGAHGLKGEVRAKVFTEDLSALAAYKRLHARDGRVFTISKIKEAKPGEAHVTFAEVLDRATAESLKGLELFVARTALPEPAREEYYRADLIGLTAMDEEGRVIGKVLAIHNYGAGDVIEIARGPDDTVMLPFARDFVPVVDVAAGRVVIAVPEEVEAGEEGSVE
ncbi:MAG: 16S rRNA processing protein RimM [Alphaproteobacteria bacterium]|nr:16S rRNA processing protein RimM [Alphaproteobacteria bacterium]MBV9692757.1 16S rRNA processing protein RimM [Alphaproteobacteria bacterium]